MISEKEYTEVGWAKPCVPITQGDDWSMAYTEVGWAKPCVPITQGDGWSMAMGTGDALCPSYDWVCSLSEIT